MSLRLSTMLLLLLLLPAWADDGQPEIEWREVPDKLDDAGLAKWCAANSDAERVSIHDTTRLTDAGLTSIARLAELHELTLEFGDKGLAAAGLAVLRTCKTLEILGIEGKLALPHIKALVGGSVTDLRLTLQHQLEDELVTAVTRLELTALDIGFSNVSKPSVTDAQLKIIGGMKGLVSLSCRVQRATPAGFAALASLTKLTTLYLSWAKDLDDASLHKLITSCPRLRKLDLHDAESVGDAGIRAIGTLTELRVLGLSWSQLTDKSMARIAKLEHLEELELYETVALTDNALLALRGLTELVKLDIGGDSKITGAGLAHLARMKKLRELDLGSGEQFDDASLANLQACAALEKLNLGWCKIQSLANLTRCLPRLKSLDVSGCKHLTDDAMKHVAAHARLEKLDIGYCDKLTPAGFATLARSPTRSKLELHLAGAYVTDAHIKALHAAVGLKALNWYNLKVTPGALKAVKAALKGTHFER